MLAMATVHGFLAGTDRTNRVLQWSAFIMGIGIVFLARGAAAHAITLGRAGSHRDPATRRGAREEIAV